MRALALAFAAGALIASGCCAPCATSCGPEGCGPCGPDTLLPHLVERTRCASGCGEVYLGEWWADPPHCDPCDQCGNYIGPVGCCKPTLKQLWGVRYEGGCCDAGCTHGAMEGHAYHGDHADHGGMYYSDPEMYDGPVEQLETPTPAEPIESSETPGAGGESASPTPTLPPDDSDLYRQKAPPLPQPARPAQPLDGAGARGPSATRAIHPRRVYQAHQSQGSPFRRRR